MAHAIYICSRDNTSTHINPDAIGKISSHIQPDNIEYPAPYISQSNGILAAITNPVKSIPIDGINLCIGGFIGNMEKWNIVGTEPPDGSYALFRGSTDFIEIYTDAVASRSIWYYINNYQFIASTSQRIIVCILQSFTPNPHSFSWMLSSGVLNSKNSWDHRIHRIPVDTKLILDRKKWDIKKTTTQIKFSKCTEPASTLKNRLAKTVDNTLDSLQTDISDWLLPLSGGYDSRALLQVLSKHRRMRTVTWGTASSLKQENSDAWIADLLSKEYATDHQFYPLPPNTINANTALTRFLKNSEGRTDHFSGYVDGFDLWKTIFNSGTHGIIRGDQAFGSKKRNHCWQLYRDWKYLTLTDYKNTNSIVQALGLPKQTRDPALLKKSDEPLGDYIERFYIEYYCANILAGLNSAKAGYCEIISPLFAKRILSVANQIPNHLRYEKLLFKQYVDERTPNIAIANHVSTTELIKILRTPEISSHILEYLINYRQDALSSQGLSLIIEQAKQELTKPVDNSLQKLITRIHNKLIRVLRLKLRQSINPLLLAFRAYIVCRMCEILDEDAELLKIKK